MLETCFSAIDQGFTSVMMDGSLEADGKTPASYEYNVDVTKQVVGVAHSLGVTVEAELGCLGGIEDGHGAGLSEEEAASHLTDPDQAGDFVRQTGCDALAVAIGTSHGAYKFKPGQKAILTSGYSETNRVKEAQHIGATIYLRKPYTMEQVGIALRKELSPV